MKYELMRLSSLAWKRSICQECKYGYVSYPEWVETAEDLEGCSFESGCMYGLENTEPTQEELEEFERKWENGHR